MITDQSSHSINLIYKNEMPSPFSCFSKCSSEDSIWQFKTTESILSFDSVASGNRMSTQNSFSSTWAPDSSGYSSLVPSSKDSSDKALFPYTRSKTWCFN
jgi:hypothetical protein